MFHPGISERGSHRPRQAQSNLGDRRSCSFLLSIVEKRTAEHEAADEPLTKHLDRSVSLRSGVLDGMYLIQHKMSAEHPGAVHFPNAGK